MFLQYLVGLLNSVFPTKLQTFFFVLNRTCKCQNLLLGFYCCMGLFWGGITISTIVLVIIVSSTKSNGNPKKNLYPKKCYLNRRCKGHLQMSYTVLITTVEEGISSCFGKISLYYTLCFCNGKGNSLT